MKIKNKSLNEKSKKWLKRHLDDEFVKKSTSLNYRSRAAYKLLEILDKFNLLHNVEKALDLGSAPGSWSLILSEKLKNAKAIVAIDLLAMKPINNVKFYKCDFLSDKFYTNINEFGAFDLILSDISPNLSGNKTSDFLRSKEIVENALNFSIKNLRKEGNFVAKYFRTGDISDLLSTAKKNFDKVSSFKPKSSRIESSEIYLVCLRKKTLIN